MLASSLCLTVLAVVGPEGVRPDSTGRPQEVQRPGGDRLQPRRWIRCSTRQGTFTNYACIHVYHSLQYDSVTFTIEQQHNLLFWCRKS